MNEFDRYQPDDWSQDGVTTTRRRPERRFLKRVKEHWLAIAAKTTVISFAFAVAAVTPVTLPMSDFVQRAAFVDVSHHAKPHSQLQDVEAGYWPKLITFLDQFSRDETVKTDFDPDPFT